MEYFFILKRWVMGYNIKIKVVVYKTFMHYQNVPRFPPPKKKSQTLNVGVRNKKVIHKNWLYDLIKPTIFVTSHQSRPWSCTNLLIAVVPLFSIRNYNSFIFDASYLKKRQTKSKSHNTAKSLTLFLCETDIFVLSTELRIFETVVRINQCRIFRS